MTPLQLHTEEWQGCQRCEYAATRNRVCILRGDAPCDILFVGEAPGESENARGFPFWGPAGRLLNRIVADAVELYGKPVTTAYTNLVGCIPREPGSKVKAKEPDGDAIEKCAPRLEELGKILSPKLIVCVGKLADKWIGDEAKGMKHRVKFDPETPTASVVHPSFILKSQYAQQGLLIQKSVVTIFQAMEEHLCLS